MQAFAAGAAKKGDGDGDSGGGGGGGATRSKPSLPSASWGKMPVGAVSALIATSDGASTNSDDDAGRASPPPAARSIRKSKNTHFTRALSATIYHVAL